MEFLNDILCITGSELLEIMSKTTYDKLIQRGAIERLRRACRSRQALIAVDSLPEKYRQRVRETFPGAATTKLHEYFRRHYKPDVEARRFYSEFRFPDGQPLPVRRAAEYTLNASVIAAVIELKNNAQAIRRATRGSRLVWEEMAQAVDFFREEYGHTLPASTPRFRKAVADFHAHGYQSLISGRFRNQNSRKVDHRIRDLLLAIDAMPQRPYTTTVAELYNAFVRGEADVYDPLTGELFDRGQFTDQKGRPLCLSESSVATCLNDPQNRILRARRHDTAYDFNNRHRPHHHRTSPLFAFSKVSLDDRDLPRKMHDGKRLKAYYAYDVASGCVVGQAYSRTKTPELLIECLRSMFRLIERHGWNCPAQVEVEHHLVSKFKGGLMKAGEVFPLVRWCNPGNSQEKRAEHFNRAKKYGVEKRTQTGIGRWYAKLEANRTAACKVFDEKNDTYREATFSARELRADDRQAIMEYNHAPHPNQKKYPGLSRWDVLCMHQNPQLAPVDKAVLYRYIGRCTPTTIRRNMYCVVGGCRYQLPEPQVLERLRSLTVQAYWLEDSQGAVGEVYLWQGERFIARCGPVELYNEADAEKTQADQTAYRRQAAYVAGFDAMVKRGKLRPVAIVRRTEKTCGTVTADTLCAYPSRAAPQRAKEQECREPDVAFIPRNDYSRLAFEEL